MSFPRKSSLLEGRRRHDFERRLDSRFRGNDETRSDVERVRAS